MSTKPIEAIQWEGTIESLYKLQTLAEGIIIGCIDEPLIIYTQTQKLHLNIGSWLIKDSKVQNKSTVPLLTVVDDKQFKESYERM